MMLDQAKVHRQRDLAVMLVCAAVIGSACTEIGRDLIAKPIAEVAKKGPRPVVVERSNAVETVATIPTRMDGRDVICTLRIDYRTRTWSMAC